MSTELQMARYDQLLRRTGDLKGPGSKVSEVLTELFPVISVEDLPLELRVLAGWRSAMIAGSITGAVAGTAAVTLFAPSNSNVIAVIERIQWFTDAADIIELDITQTVFGGGQTKGLFRDSRLGGDRLSTLFVTSSNSASTDGILRLETPADLLQTIEDDSGLFVLSPGNAVQLGFSSVVNKNLAVNYWWRERTAEPSELGF